MQSDEDTRVAVKPRDDVRVIEQKHGTDWAAYRGDSVELVQGLPENSVDLSVYSPPFASLYTYSASDRDMGNCKSHEEFREHYGYLLSEMLRVLRPGRIMAVHCMVLPTSKCRDGHIGLSDFPGHLIRSAEDVGWIYHSRVVIWKDPVTAMQRTKALGLLHKQLLKDSCMSRMGIPDEVVYFRKPGENPRRVTNTREGFPVSLWQKWASPVWDDINPSDTLQYHSAREHQDERHICPLQLEVIRRVVHLYSNPGEVVLSPFMGIGSEGVVALRESRRFVGLELKESYFRQAIRNLAGAVRQQSLFEEAAE